MTILQDGIYLLSEIYMFDSQIDRNNWSDKLYNIMESVYNFTDKSIRKAELI